MFEKGEFFFSGLAYRLHQVQKHSPELRGAFENTGLSFRCGRTHENRDDVIIVAFLCGKTKNSSNTPCVDAICFKTGEKISFFKIIRMRPKCYSLAKTQMQQFNQPFYHRNGLDASASIRIKKRIFSFRVLLPVFMLFYLCHRSF